MQRLSRYLSYQRINDSPAPTSSNSIWIITTIKKYLSYKLAPVRAKDEGGIQHHTIIGAVIFFFLAIFFALQGFYFFSENVPEKVGGSAALTVGSSIIQGVTLLSSLVITFLALALPLTANFYTPRLVEIFLKDTINILFLCTFGIFSSVSVFTDAFVFEDTTIGWIPFSIFTSYSLVGWAVIIPYYFYVLRFLRPEVIINEVGALIDREISFSSDRVLNSPATRFRISKLILQLGEIGEKSLGRVDRQTTIHVLNELTSCFAFYRHLKSKLPNELFNIQQSEFPFLLKSGVNWISHSKYWVEELILRQIQKIYSSSLKSLPGLVSFISLSIRKLCEDILVQQSDDKIAVILCFRFFNSFLSESIERRDDRAFQNVLYQYIQLSKYFSRTAPEYLPTIFKYFEHYFRMSRETKMVDAINTSNYYFSNLTLYLFRSNNWYREDFLVRFLSLYSSDYESENDYIPISERKGVLHSRIILGATLLYFSVKFSVNFYYSITLVINHLSFASLEEINNVCDYFLSTTSELDWEITDNMINFDYLTDEQRKILPTFISEIEKSRNVSNYVVSAKNADLYSSTAVENKLLEYE